MTHEEKKVGKIIEELTMYFFGLGATRITSSIERHQSGGVIIMESNYALEYSNQLERLSEFLNEPKDDSVEDIYWELAGSGDPGESGQLLLLGMMLDSAEVEITLEKVNLKLYKELL